MKKRFTTLTLSTLLLWSQAFQTLSAESFSEIFSGIDTQRMMSDIQKLSHDEFAGRQAGTSGGRKSAAFVQERLERLGLNPRGNSNGNTTKKSWFQRAPITVPKIQQIAPLTFSSFLSSQESFPIHSLLGSDYLPVLDSPSVNVMAPVVFVGYGIDDPALGVSDYEGMDVKNRIVMFLRGKPKKFSRWVTHEEKERTARRLGAVGFITLTGPILSRYEASRGLGHAPLAVYSSPPDERPLPGAWISGQVGETLFESQKISLQKTQVQLNALSNRSQELGILAHLQWDSAKELGTLINVLGAIPGHDPILREEIVIIGAHRDHFGRQSDVLFPGADDNSSGTALLLEIARIMAETKTHPKRTILFASFSGEERGLLGSKLYVKSPSYALKKTAAMINVDHVGVGNGKLTVGITRLPKSIGEQAAKLANLGEKTNFYGYFPGGDHVPFYQAKVPTITVVSAGKHTAFHQPSDTPEKIQPEILQNATRYVFALTWLLADK